MSALDRLSAWVTGWLPESARWRIADRVNRHVPGQCWSDLVDWALREPKDDPDWRSDMPLRPIKDGCRSDAISAGRCYCGKLGSDGTILGPGESVCVTRMPGRETDRLCTRPNGHDGSHRCGVVEWGAA